MKENTLKKKSSGNYRLLFILTLFVSLVLNIGLIHAQADYVTLVGGIISDSQNSSPIQTTVVFIEDNGKEVKAKSDIKGHYQAVLVSGKTYTVAFKGYFFANQEESKIELEPRKAYTEVNKNFALSKIKTGMQLISISAFAPKSVSISPNALSYIYQIKAFYNQNKNINFNISISTEDALTSKTKTPKSKKSKPIVQENTLFTQRMESLKIALSDAKIPEHSYQIVEANNMNNPVKTAPKTKGKKNTKETKETKAIDFINLKIEIAKIMNIN